MSSRSIESLRIYIDGAARGNPGPAGIGVVIADGRNNAIRNVAKYIGNATNNVAEYTALIFALEEARNMGAKEITINTDSELLAKQLGGEYKVKNSALKDLYAKITDMLNSFDEVSVNQIERSQNKGADKLANKAVDKVQNKKVGRSFVLRSKDKIRDSLI